MPRPTKLTPDIQHAIVEAMRAGNYFEAACTCAGVSVAAGYEWRQRGQGTHPSRSAEPVYVEFAEAISKAEAEAEQRIVGLWQAQIPGDWRAARDFLARRFPGRWGPKELSRVLQVTYTPEQIAAMTDEQLEAEARRLGGA